MKIRGQRECRDCGRQWSYYETGSVTCPACGSLRSVGVDEYARHTDGPAELDLTEHREAFDVDAGSLDDLAKALKSTLRSYRSERGFINAGELVALDDTYLAATELLHAVDVYARRTDRPDDEHLYVLSLLRDADHGVRPDPEAVPPSMSAARGLAYAEAVDDYRREVLTWLDDNPDPEARRTLGTLREQLKRVEALQGDVSLREADTLVTAMRNLSTYLREGDESALVAARDRLERLAA